MCVCIIILKERIMFCITEHLVMLSRELIYKDASNTFYNTFKITAKLTLTGYFLGTEFCCRLFYDTFSLS